MGNPRPAPRRRLGRASQSRRSTMATPISAQPTSPGATITHDGKTVGLPVVRGSEGEAAIDIQALRSQTRLITMDPGYGNTGACRSVITFIDGEKGILLYRGYAIAETA